MKKSVVRLIFVNWIIFLVFNPIKIKAENPGTFTCVVNNNRCELNNDSCNAGYTNNCNRYTAADCPTAPTNACVDPGGKEGDPEKTLIDLGEVLENMPGNFRFKTDNTLGFIITVALPFVYGLSGFALLIMLVASGFSYLTSTGDPKKMEQAKTMLTNAIIGFALIVVAYWLTGMVNYIFKLGVGIQ